jgi:hypothetical protein
VSLIDLQRAALALCVSTEAPAEALATLGDERIWRLYRDLVRDRLRAEVGLSLKRTKAAAGEAFELAFEHYLAYEPPRTRFFHGIAESFAASAVPFFRGRGDVLPHVADLARYEAALWSVADLPDPDGEPVLELAFDLRPVFTPALRLLEVEHAVHRKPLDGAYERGRFPLCVYRRAQDKKARTLVLNATSHDLVQRLLAGAPSVSDAVRELAQARQIVVDEKFVDGLCTVLADFLDRGILLGSR